MSDVTEVGQLVLRERQSRVRGLRDALAACFHADATVETSWSRGSASAFVAGAAARSANSGPIINRVGAPVISVNGSRAVVELPSTTIRWIPVNEVEAVLTSYMRLIYRAERRDGVWKISDLQSVNEGDTLEAAVPGTDLRVDPLALDGLRPSYRYLAYTRLLDGTAVSQDLLGIDRPDALVALYADAGTWLEAGR